MSFWFNKCIGGIGLLSEHVYYVDIQEVEKTIFDVYYNTDWHLEEIVTRVPTLFISHIYATIAEVIIVEDKSPNALGKYSTTFGYHWLLEKFRVLLSVRAGCRFGSFVS